MENNNTSSKDNKDSNTNNKINPTAPCFFALPPKQFALLSSVIGVLLTEDLDLNQQNSLGNFLVSLGSTILASAAQGSLIQSRCNKNSNG